jgi:hypothetical protein
LAALASGATQAGAAEGRFDGAWSVILACPKAPDGALPFTFRFAATVTGGVLHGENGAAGHPGWMVLDGPIQPDGGAALNARGLTGGPAYNVNNTARGVPYRHDVTAHFNGAGGTGQWVTNRVCDFTFTRN